MNHAERSLVLCERWKEISNDVALNLEEATLPF